MTLDLHWNTFKLRLLGKCARSIATRHQQEIFSAEAVDSIQIKFSHCTWTLTGAEWQLSKLGLPSEHFFWEIDFSTELSPTDIKQIALDLKRICNTVSFFKFGSWHEILESLLVQPWFIAISLFWQTHENEAFSKVYFSSSFTISHRVFDFSQSTPDISVVRV